MDGSTNRLAKAFPTRRDPEEDLAEPVGKVDGFSLHAGVSARADEQKKLKRLCRYINRPTISE